MRGLSNLIFGGIFIVGGASGKLALIGTNSSVALLVVGVAMAGYGGYQMFASRQ